MIVATAGHIDHGKTGLVTALTGVDTDRLPEEKRRGMTIDLGFAYWRGDDDVLLGFVDVPGHDRFVHTMVAGVGAVDFALLIVAADDGLMPQTREHLSILSLLGIRRGAIVVSKADKSESGRATDVANAVRAIATDNVWRSAPHFAVSSLTGEGIASLLRHLADQAKQIQDRRPTLGFRMTADRVFKIDGAGLVVSGAVIAGQVGRGDHVVVSPAGMSARVRQIHANNRESDVATAGDRCALNLVLERSGTIRRGDWIAAPDTTAPTCRFDAHLHILESAAKQFRSGVRIHLHVGTADVTARVDVLSRTSLAPGESGMVQIITEKPVDVLCTDRFIIRDRSATMTLGGGSVIDPWPAVRGRARPQRIAILDAMADPSPHLAFSRLLTASEQGIDWDDFRRAWNLTDGTANEILAHERVVELKTAKARIMLAPDKWDALSRRIAEVMSQWHAERPDEIGPSQRDLAARLA
ncbi:MAG: selenocysteine-specific translation elongation factor, partial [Pseudorhodoplanes sp.]